MCFIGILVLVLVLTAGGIIALVHHERNAMARDLAESRATVGKLEAELKTLRTERDSLQKQLQKLSDAIATRYFLQGAQALREAGLTLA